tara:strand:- start:20151 stop:20621 length:471 start_codon:yes stop_codon:yes gene_type:complete
MKKHTSFIYLFFLVLCLYEKPLAQRSSSRFSDQQIVAMTGSYLKRMPGSPEFMGAKVYRHPEKGKIYQIHLQVDRNRETEGLGYAFDTMLALSEYFKKPPKIFIAVLHSNNRSAPPVICSGSVKCTSDHYIKKVITYKDWYNNCIKFEKPTIVADL